MYAGSFVGQQRMGSVASADTCPVSLMNPSETAKVGSERVLPSDGVSCIRGRRRGRTVGKGETGRCRPMNAAQGAQSGSLLVERHCCSFLSCSEWPLRLSWRTPHLCVARGSSAQARPPAHLPPCAL